MISAVFATLTIATVDLDAGEKRAMLLHPLAPAAAAKKIPRQEMLEALEAALSGTAIDAISVEEAGLDERELGECPAAERYACWISRAGALALPPRYLLVIGVLPVTAGVELSAIVLDVEAAKTARARLEESAPDRDALEAAMFAIAVSAPPKRFDATKPDALITYFRELYGTTLRPVLEANDHARPLGTIRIESGLRELTVELDEKKIGGVLTGGARLINVLPGRRVLSLEAAGGFKEKREVAVESGAEALVRVDPPEPAHPLSTPTLWGGVVLTVAGGGVVLASVLSAGGDHRALCLERTAGDLCPDRSAIALPGLADRLAVGEGALEPRGVPLGVLGASIAGAGLVLFAGTAFTELCEKEPWWCWVAALAAGTGGYALGAALGP